MKLEDALYKNLGWVRTWGS